MFHFPNLGFPYYNRYTRYGYHYPYYTYNKAYMYNKPNTNYDFKNKKDIKITPSDINKNSYKEEKKSSSSDDSPLFQLFGIDLYFDDILLICLIWFINKP